MLIGDHAGGAIPAALGGLGLPEAELARHIAVDIGTEPLGQALSERLGAPFVRQVYSRLVVDCNRDPAHSGWIVEESDGTLVAGNQGLREDACEARRVNIFEPYHRAIGQMLDAMTHPDPVLVSLHSFTPVMGGAARPWEIGVLHNGRRDDFALAFLAALAARGDLTIGDNAPYRMDETDYTVPRHAWTRELPYVEIEVRQDMLRDEAGVAWATDILAEALHEALAA